MQVRAFERYIPLNTYKGCPSKSWTFVITRDCVTLILCYFADVFIYILMETIFFLNKYGWNRS